MKPFESFLAPHLNDYLRYREGLGYAPQPCTDHLLRFDRYLHQSGADWNSLHPSFFLHMRTNLAMEAVSVNHVLSFTRGFFRFLVRKGIFEKNPLLDIPRLKEEITVPYIFSPQQTDQLLKTICNKMQRSKASFLKEFALYMAILLMARCGLRISEPLHLLKQHYRREEGTIYIQKTKFKKDRLIPVPKAVMQEMENYLSVREHLAAEMKLSVVNAAPEAAFANPSHRKALGNLINSAIARTEAGNYTGALAQMRTAVLPRMNDCNPATADNVPDWIVDCAVQAEAYRLVVKSIDLLTRLLA